MAKVPKEVKKERLTEKPTQLSLEQDANWIFRFWFAFQNLIWQK